MEVVEGGCRFGLWWVHVSWKGDMVYRVHFTRNRREGRVPVEIRRYCSGKSVDLTTLRSAATEGDGPYVDIYRAVCRVPYGSTATYGQIAREVGTAPRVVGMAMKRNPTPLVVPCHRIVSQYEIGGFTPDPEIKRELLRMESGGSAGK